MKKNSYTKKNIGMKGKVILKTTIWFVLAIIFISNISGNVAFASEETGLPKTNVALSSIGTDTEEKTIDIENKKYEIASDRTLQYNLALLADAYGFGWCGGTKTPYIGDDFDVYKDGENYVIQAHYDKNDPYAKGYRGNERLKITLSNFRYTVDPNSINFGTPVVTNYEPKAVDTVMVKNYRDASDDVTLNMQYSQADTCQHTSSYKFSEGLKLGTKFKAKVPFIGDAENSAEFSFGAEQGWTDSSTQSTNKTLTTSVNCKNIQPNHQAEIEALLSTSKCDVPYTATAQMVFDVSFQNFLAWSGNAAKRTDRPIVIKTFGNGDETAAEAISRIYDHRNITGYDTDVINSNQKIVWDWSWIQQHKGWASSAVDGIKNQKFTFQLSGKFTKISGNNLILKTLKDEPIIEPKTSKSILISRKVSPLIQIQANSASGNPVTIESLK